MPFWTRIWLPALEVPVLFVKRRVPAPVFVSVLLPIAKARLSVTVELVPTDQVWLAVRVTPRTNAEVPVLAAAVTPPAPMRMPLVALCPSVWPDALKVMLLRVRVPSAKLFVAVALAVLKMRSSPLTGI